MTHYEKQSMKELCAGMGEGLVEAGKRNENVVALSADVKGSVKMDGFAKEFPERFIQCGIAEANMVGIADGTLVALTLMIAESRPEEKDVMVKVVVNLINKNNQ
ncbi:MAG: hypothetical protein IJT39_04645 [Bacteroidales bacterium]|nr:hypothetical protein [Bacteroidales bacterium]